MQIRCRFGSASCSAAGCFQLMEAAGEAALSTWIARWSDLIDFEVIPVVAPAEYWACIGTTSAADRTEGP